ncbi:sulfatase-like hydrolase/transferase [Lacibacter sp. H407]|uniref:sulfatase-like hydrolase/transferase n=1 Tax=Lacibacter sp. H407 TaxID=3133423 RepID=UPI0030C4C419
MKKKLKIKLQQKAYFLALLPLVFILHGNNAFFGFFPASFVILNLSIVLLTSLLLYACCYIFIRNKRKAVILSFWLLLFILSFGFLHDSTKKIMGDGFFSSYKFIFVISLFLLVVFFVLIKKRNSLFQRHFFFINTLIFSLLLYELVDSIIQFSNYKNEKKLLDNRFNASKQARINTTIPDSIKPDIYFLVFDALPSSIAMKSEWGFDNSFLDSFLLKEKFYVHSKSKSNYNLTVLSVSSTLNMDYTPAVNLYQDEAKMYFKATASLLDNSLTRILEQQNYEIKQYQPISFANKDWHGKLFFGNILYMNYFYQTLPGRVYRDLGWNVSRLNMKILNNRNFKKYHSRNLTLQNDLLQTKLLVKKSCSLTKEKKQFVYAHFQLPHDPFIFDSSGKLKPTEKTILYSEEEQPAAFIEQVKFANKIIQELVVHIKKTNRQNTVIIIEGDHGYRNITGKKGYMIFDNFNSVYLPDNDYTQHYSTMSPVNSFRLVLNKFFTANLPLLKDSSIFIPYTLPGEK